MQAERLEQAAASILICGLAGVESDESIRSLLRRGLGGIILFRRNIAHPVQTAALINKLQAARADALPLLMSVDQEGGKVARLKAPLTEFPDQAFLGRTGDEDLAWRFGRVLALELTALGFNLDYAPVVDVDSNPENPVIGSRAFSADPQVVARMGAAVIRGMQENGLLACAKHFPGHGDTRTDSHLELPELPHDLERLEAVELVPFRAAIRAGVATMMTAHVRFNAVDSSVPATLSPRVIQGILREKLGYEGVIISDDLEMKAVLDHFGIAESVRLGILAGVDCFLVCHEYSRMEAAIETLVHEAEKSSHFKSMLLAASARVTRLRASLPAYEGVDEGRVESVLGLPAQLAVADEIRQRGALGA
jgi:beta-N-acetylhexosaminidase